MMSLSSKLAPLLATPQPPDLGPGPRAAGVRTAKEIRRDVETALASAAVSAGNRELALGLVLLWHDHLDAAHEIAQAHETQDGSYLHAIVHRREPDYSNAKYWFRRVGQHPCYPELAHQVKAPAENKELATKLIRNGEWDSFAFVDACEAADSSRKHPTTRLLQQIQAAEFKIFLSYLAGEISATKEPQ